jgi:dihydrodipicolinate synthase/N-acetylneuraminate lyase
LKEYAGILEVLCEAAGQETVVIPSLGPAFGTMMDQVHILQQFDFPTAMVLPERSVATPRGVQTGLRRVVEAYGKPVILYLKDENFLPVEAVARLVSDGLIFAIKYAIVRDDPLDDDYLRSLVAQVNPLWILSGIGEQPAIVHLREFGLAGFTSGCVTIAPKLSLGMLRAAQRDDYETAESIRRLFKPLEDLRNRIHPIRVLHDAVTCVGIANAGPMLPLLDNLTENERQQVKETAAALSKTQEVSP